MGRGLEEEAYSCGLANLAVALQNWKDSRTGKRKGTRAGFPHRKDKHRARLSCRFTTGAIRCESRHAVLPRLGRIKLHEGADALVSKVAAGSARVQSATVRGPRRRPVSFGVEVGIAQPARLSARARSPGWTWASRSWRCCLTALRCSDPKHWSRHSGSSGGCADWDTVGGDGRRRDPTVP